MMKSELGVKYKNVIITGIILVVFLLLSDYLISLKPIFSEELWGVVDNFVHAVAAVIILSPFYKRFGYSGLAVFFLSASALDFDHFISLKTLSLSVVITMQMRPFTHSASFGMLMGAIVYLISRNKFYAWIIFIAIASHVVRDASDGLARFLFPLPYHYIPYWIYILLEVIMLLSSFLLREYTEKDYIVKSKAL